MKLQCRWKRNTVKLQILNLAIFFLIILTSNIAFAAEPTQDSAPNSTTESTELVAAQQALQAIQDRQNSVLNNYLLHRKEFEDKKKEITSEVEKEHAQLLAELQSIQKEIDEARRFINNNPFPGSPSLPPELQEDITEVRDSTNFYRDLRYVLGGVIGFCASIIVPWAMILNFFGDFLTSYVLGLSLSVMVVNFTVYLYYAKRKLFNRYRKKLILLIVIVIVASATSVAAAPADKRQDVETKLKYAENLLSKSGNQKAIAILEKKQTNVITLPADVQSGDPLLWLEKKVEVDSAEYYLTLAALYAAEGEVTKSVEALTKIAEKRELKNSPNARIIVAVIHFLVEKNHQDTASNAVLNHTNSINNSKTLLDLFAYLEKKNMQVSSNHVLDLIIKKTATSDGFLALANYYQQAGEKDKAFEALQKALDRCGSIHEIINVVRAAMKMSAEAILQKVPEKAKQLQGDSAQLIKLARIYHEIGESQFVEHLLLRTLNNSKTVDEIIEKITIALELNQDSILKHARERTLVIYRNIGTRPKSERFKEAYADCLRLVDHLLSINRHEDSALLFADMVKMIKKGKRVNEHYIALMMNLARDAMQRGLKVQAAKILFKLTFRIKPREMAYVTYPALPDELLRYTEDLPESERVSIPLLNGILQEEVNKFSDAEKAYMQAVLYSLQPVLDSYGEHSPETLNEYYLLGRLWHKDKRTDSLELLDRVYSLLESHMLAKIKEKERKRIIGETQKEISQARKNLEQWNSWVEDRKVVLEQRNQEYKLKQDELAQEARILLKEKRSNLNILRFKTMLKLLAVLCIVAVIIGFIIGTIYFSWKYCRRMREHKAYGFVAKFFELNGWLRLFSIFGFFSGIMLVISSQLMQMLQKMHELLLLKNPDPGYLGYIDDTILAEKKEDEAVEEEPKEPKKDKT